MKKSIVPDYTHIYSNIIDLSHLKISHYLLYLGSLFKAYLDHLTTTQTDYKSQYNSHVYTRIDTYPLLFSTKIRKLKFPCINFVSSKIIELHFLSI